MFGAYRRNVNAIFTKAMFSIFLKIFQPQCRKLRVLVEVVLWPISECSSASMHHINLHSDWLYKEIKYGVFENLYTWTWVDTAYGKVPCLSSYDLGQLEQRWLPFELFPIYPFNGRHLFPISLEAREDCGCGHGRNWIKIFVFIFPRSRPESFPTLCCQAGQGSFSFSSLLGKASKKKTVFFWEISPKCGGWGVLFPKKVQTPQNLPKSPPPA